MSGVLRNCHTCARNWQDPASGYNYCRMLQGDDVYKLTMEWMEAFVVGTGSDMPRPAADGCPGWMARASLAPENTDRAQLASLGDSATIRPDSANGWRGHLPLCRGPGGIQARRLRALVRW